MVVATDAAFFNALFVTSKGSIIPALIILTSLPVTTFIPLPFNLGYTSDIPALSNMVK